MYAIIYEWNLSVPFLLVIERESRLHEKKNLNISVIEFFFSPEDITREQIDIFVRKTRNKRANPAYKPCFKKGHVFVREEKKILFYRLEQFECVRIDNIDLTPFPLLKYRNINFAPSGF